MLTDAQVLVTGQRRARQGLAPKLAYPADAGIRLCAMPAVALAI